METSRPVERRITSFNRKPTDHDLGTDLGYGLMGGSTQLFRDDDKFFQVDPQRIPVKLVAIWMYFVLAIMAILVWCSGNADEMAWAIVLGGAIMIVPVMIFGAAWINDATGVEPFLVYDKKANRIELPRLSAKYSRDRLREVIFLERFVDRNIFWQVGLVIEEGNGMWTYLHLFNTADAGRSWPGMKPDHQKIGEALGITSRRVTFTKAESAELASLVPWLDHRFSSNESK